MSLIARLYDSLTGKRRGVIAEITPGGVYPNEIKTTAFTAVANVGYITSGVTIVSVTLPILADLSDNDRLKFVSDNAEGFRLTVPTGQVIKYNGSAYLATDTIDFTGISNGVELEYDSGVWYSRPFVEVEPETVNFETIGTGTRTMLDTDVTTNVFTMSGIVATVNLPTTGISDGKIFIISLSMVSTSAVTKYIKLQLGGANLDSIYAAQVKGYIFDSSTSVWTPYLTGSASSATRLNKGLGIGANSVISGADCTSIGLNSQATTGRATSIGSVARAGFNCVAVGYTAIATNSSIVLGVDVTASNPNSIAVGIDSAAQNDNIVVLGSNVIETRRGVKIIGYEADGKNKHIKAYWRGTLTTPADEEIYLDGQLGERLTLLTDGQRIGFSLKIDGNEVGTDNMYYSTVEGVIQRTLSGVVVMRSVSLTAYVNDIGATENITADNVNKALKISFTNSGTVVWKVEMNGFETNI